MYLVQPSTGVIAMASFADRQRRTAELLARMGILSDDSEDDSQASHGEEGEGEEEEGGGGGGGGYSSDDYARDGFEPAGSTDGGSDDKSGKKHD